MGGWGSLPPSLPTLLMPKQGCGNQWRRDGGEGACSLSYPKMFCGGTASTENESLGEEEIAPFIDHKRERVCFAFLLVLFFPSAAASVANDYNERKSISPSRRSPKLPRYLHKYLNRPLAPSSGIYCMHKSRSRRRHFLRLSFQQLSSLLALVLLLVDHRGVSGLASEQLESSCEQRREGGGSGIPPSPRT